ncbi:DUF1499 domain-containing protein [Aurantimonas sp. Leaf443]|uniref:DUF1499 domain-containing protein n=1 Tax=Aurantimonas sp. Leaf443 TaxID=1736378 RepID=UPI0006FCCC34|nr:DUF1499 domain-containing protein [Aurantimonas sp. Leaf443]KQT88094.1 hypothetical protein ASG48_01175 [Aurantimonas sp. Leaf443]
MKPASLRLPGTGHYLRGRLGLARPARAGAVFALLLILVAILSFRLGILEARPLVWALVLAGGIAALAALVALGGLVRAWFTGALGAGAALGALVLSLLALLPFGLAGWLASVNPPVASAQTEGFAAAPSDAALVSGRRFSAAAPDVYAAARVALKGTGWAVEEVATRESEAPDALAGGDLGVSGTVAIPLPTPRAAIDARAGADPLERPDSTAYRIEAVARDLLFALPSDVTIRILQEGGETFVDLSSASRGLDLDFGQNRRFIEGFLARLDEAVTTLETVPTGD